MKNKDLKYEVTEEKVWIPLKDGTKLAATLYRPKSEKKFPAILQYLPYRKDDSSAVPSKKSHHYFAERGYVGARVDIRGTGSSEGMAENEYVLQEQLDGYEVVEWLAAQEWCTGKVGMWGQSYGGCNPVHLASHNPPSLKAIAPIHFFDDGYTDGDHFEGGCLSKMGLGYYGMMMLAMNGLPPDPSYFEAEAGRWEEMWRKRLEEYVPWVLAWFDHQTLDDFWRVQSLRPDYDAIKCPVLMIGGWGDHFRNSVFRMLEHLTVPKKAIVGPWVHSPPDIAYPGPNIDYFHELLRWWDYWLKGIDNGVMDEPPLAVYVQRNREPHMFADFAEGYWKYEKGWPLEDGMETTYYLHSHGILAEESPTAEHETCDQYQYRPDTGVMGNIWFSQACSLGQEQSLDEAFSLTYTSELLGEDLEILGFPQVKLFAASSAENTTFVVKLTEVNPEGQSNLITYGVLNASHRNSHEDPEALEPGRVYELDIEMAAVSWVFKKGHRIRVSVSSSHWPILWPLPEPAVNQVYRDKAHRSKIVLPIVSPRELSQEPVFMEPVHKPTPNVKAEPVGKPSIKIIRDTINEETIVEVVSPRRVSTLTDRQLTCTRSGAIQQARVSTKDPALASLSVESLFELQYDSGLNVSALGKGVVSSNRKQFFIHLDLNIEVNGEPYFKKSWLKTVPRNFV